MPVSRRDPISPELDQPALVTKGQDRGIDQHQDRAEQSNSDLEGEAARQAAVPFLVLALHDRVQGGFVHGIKRLLVLRIPDYFHLTKLHLLLLLSLGNLKLLVMSNSYRRKAC